MALLHFSIVAVATLILLTGNISPALSKDLHIGGLFDISDSASESAFRLALNRVNNDGKLKLADTKLVATSGQLPSNPYFATNKICQILGNNGLVAIVGPSSSTSSHVQSICDALDIPHVTRSLQGSKNAINMFPQYLSLGQAYVDVIRELDWKSFTILYEDDDELIPFQKLLLLANTPGYKINVRQLIETDDDYRTVLKKIEQEGIRNILLACSSFETLTTILKQAQQVGLITSSYSFLMTSLDLHMIDFEDYRHSGVAIFGLSLLHPNSTENTETAMTYDAVRVIARGLQELNRNTDIRVKPLDCNGNETWIHGNSLLHYMKMAELEGMTGLIKFDSQGFRTNFNLNVLELNREGLTSIGSWNPIKGVNITPVFMPETSLDEKLANKTLIVTSILNHPYFMLKDSAAKLTGNDRFEGFGVDLIEEISELLGFDYELKLVEDSKYGSFNPETKEWNGIIRELLDEKADMSIADLTITSERQSVVEFSHPFMDTGITILFKAPPTVSNMFVFLAPFSLEVWISLLAVTVGIIISIFILAKLSPFERVSPHQGDPNSKESENAFSFLNSIWFTISSLMQQGCDLNVKATSTRLMAGTWWIFTLILVLTYIANLAALLTIEETMKTKAESPISSIYDLSENPDIKFGMFKGGSTYSFFRNSKLPYYKKMWRKMEEEDRLSTPQNPGPYTQSNMEGIERVQDSDGHFAFLMESSTVEYVTGKRCDLTQIGTRIDLKSYGIAMKPGMPFKDGVNQAMLRLKETNQLQTLKNKWWKKSRDGACDSEDGVVQVVGLANVVGVFCVLIVGLFIAVVIGFCEFFWEARKTVKAGTNSWGGLLCELGSDLYTGRSVKPLVRPNRDTFAPEQDESKF